MSLHCHLTRKRPLIGRDSLSREQREIPGFVLEWFEQEQGVGPPGQRQSRERESRERFLVLFIWFEHDQELE